MPALTLRPTWRRLRLSWHLIESRERHSAHSGLRVPMPTELVAGHRVRVSVRLILFRGLLDVHSYFNLCAR